MGQCYDAGSDRESIISEFAGRIRQFFAPRRKWGTLRHSKVTEKQSLVADADRNHRGYSRTGPGRDIATRSGHGACPNI